MASTVSRKLLSIRQNGMVCDLHIRSIVPSKIQHFTGGSYKFISGAAAIYGDVICSGIFILLTLACKLSFENALKSILC